MRFHVKFQLAAYCVLMGLGCGGEPPVQPPMELSITVITDLDVSVYVDEVEQFPTSPGVASHRFEFSQDFDNYDSWEDVASVSIRAMKNGATIDSVLAVPRCKWLCNETSDLGCVELGYIEVEGQGHRVESDRFLPFPEIQCVGESGLTYRLEF